MLGKKHANSRIKAYYDAPEDRIEMGIHVSLGIACDLVQEPHAIVLPLSAPVTIAGEPPLDGSTLRSELRIEPARRAPPSSSPALCRTRHRARQCRNFTPAQPTDSDASLRDFHSGAYSR
jgi:hypothetical protein